MKKYLIMVVTMFLVAITIGAGVSSSANAGAQNKRVPVIHVDSPSDVPPGAVLLYHSVRENDCRTTTKWRLTVPGNDQTSHQEFRFKRDVPAVEEQSHMEYKYQRTVVDYKTQYHFRKFTHTKTRTETKHNGHWVWGPWSDYGPWTPWVPETHESWQDNDTPLGNPEFHGQGQDGHTQWYRQWQAQFDGETRQVENGSHVETTDWLTAPPAGDGWQQIDSRKVIDVEGVPGYTEYFVLGETPSQNEVDASWILLEQLPVDQGWVQFDDRTVIDTVETPDVVTDYVYDHHVTCHSSPPKHHTPPQPGVPTLIDAGL